MTQDIQSLVAAADAVVPRIDADEARTLIEAGAVLLDVREPPELAGGKLAGALNIPRGDVAFLADPASPSHHPELSPDRTVVIYCAAGVRAALAGLALHQLGYEAVYNLGGFSGAAASGFEVE